MQHVVVGPHPVRPGWQLISFLRRRAGRVEVSDAPQVYLKGPVDEATELCRLQGWRVEHLFKEE